MVVVEQISLECSRLVHSELVEMAMFHQVPQFSPGHELLLLKQQLKAPVLLLFFY